MESQISLDEEQFNDFLRCLTNLKEICNDVDIRNGVVRQRSNDLTSIFEMDMTSIIGEASIPITNLKKKLDLMKSFAGSEVTIDITEEESESESFFSFADGVTSVKFIFPSIEFMDNKFMSEEELENIFNLQEDDLFLSDDLSTKITEKIRIFADNFNTQAIQVKFNQDKAAITASTQSKDQFAKFKSDIATNIEFNGNYISNLSTIPFSIEHDTELNLKCINHHHKM
jgi:hypothetical protein